jgi:phosphoribosylformimino-5-aminoimidazole carboxamide ribotide isomerase
MSSRQALIARHPPSHFAELYRTNGLTGGHIIKLGPGNDQAAREACQTWPGGMQVGGGITESNAEEWLRAGASKVRRVVATSHSFHTLRRSPSGGVRVWHAGQVLM